MEQKKQYVLQFHQKYLCCHRSDLNVTVDIYVPEVNATSGVLIGVRMDQASCTVFIARGLFLFLNFDDGHIVVARDLGKIVNSLWK